MSKENNQNPAPPSQKEIEDKKVQEKRDEIRKLLEGKQFPNIIKNAFQIIQDKDKRLISDALDAIRQVTVEMPALIDASQLNVLVEFLHDEDDILRASAVLALKPIILQRPDDLFQLLTTILSVSTSKNGKEESIRLLGHMAGEHPDKIEKLIPDLVNYLSDDNVHVRKRSLEVLKILSKDAPGKIEKEVKKIAGKITDAEILSGINEVMTEAIKKRELKSIDDKIPKEGTKPEIIPEVAPQPTKAEIAEEKKQQVPPGAPVQIKPVQTEEEIKKEIGAKIQAEFSKIEEGVKQAPSELKELKEIKTTKDLTPSSAPAVPAKGAEPVPATQKVEAVPEEKKEPAIIPETKDTTVKKQLDLKEKELQRREEELKKVELEKKELELQAKELDMQREELKKQKLEQMELEVKRKEEELKEKELSLKMKELEEKEKKLKEIEKSFQKDE